MGHCPTKNLTGWHIQLVVRNSWWVSLRRRLAGEMAHGSLQLAIAPRAFASRVSGVATPGKCPHCSVRDWPSARTGSAPTLHQRVLVGAPPASHPFSPLLLSVQGLEPCNRIGSTLLDGKYPRNTAFYGNDAHRGRSDLLLLTICPTKYHHRKFPREYQIIVLACVSL